MNSSARAREQTVKAVMAQNDAFKVELEDLRSARDVALKLQRTVERLRSGGSDVSGDNLGLSPAGGSGGNGSGGNGAGGIDADELDDLKEHYEAQLLEKEEMATEWAQKYSALIVKHQKVERQLSALQARNKRRKATEAATATAAAAAAAATEASLENANLAVTPVHGGKQARPALASLPVNSPITTGLVSDGSASKGRRRVLGDLAVTPLGASAGGKRRSLGNDDSLMLSESDGEGGDDTMATNGPGAGMEVGGGDEATGECGVQ